MRNFAMGNLGRVLVVEADDCKAEKQRLALLDAHASAVEVVKYEFQALVRLANRNNDYNLVMLHGNIRRPDVVRTELLGDLDLCGDVDMN